jgi:hypothetical protein
MFVKYERKVKRRMQSDAKVLKDDGFARSRTLFDGRMNLGEEDIVGLVFGFELVATDDAVGAAEVALVSKGDRGSRRRRKRTWEVGAGGGVINGLGGKISF